MPKSGDNARPGNRAEKKVSAQQTARRKKISDAFDKMQTDRYANQGSQYGASNDGPGPIERAQRQRSLAGKLSKKEAADMRAGGSGGAARQKGIGVPRAGTASRKKK